MSADGRSRAGVVSARGALAVAACAALAAIGLSGPAWVGPVGVASAVVLGWGVGALDPSRTRRLAAGSISVLVGAGGLVAAVGLVGTTGRAGHAVLLVGVAAVALAALADVTGEWPGRLTRVASESGFVALVALALAVAWYLLVGTGFAPGLVEWAFARATAAPVLAAVWLQAAALAAGLAADRAARALESLAPGRTGAEGELAAAFRLTADDVPRWYVGALVVVGLAGSTVFVRDAVAGALAARPLLATVVESVLLDGVVHAALGVVLAVSLCVAAAPAVHRAVVFWTGPAPGDTVAAAAGGFAAVAVALAGSVLAVLTRAFDISVGVVAVPSPVAVAVPALVGALCALLVVLAFVHGLAVVTRRLARRTGGFALGAALVLVGAALLADALPTIAVVAAAAGSLAVWDLGVHAAGFDRDLPGVRPPARTELVHATAIGAVLVAAAGVALLVGYVAVPVRVPDERATVALALVMISLVAFAVALRE